MEELIIPQQSKTQGYKLVCAKLGIMMSVYFLCRTAAGMCIALLYRYAGGLGGTVAYVMASTINVMLVYMVPLLSTAIIFKSFAYYEGKLPELYKKPNRLARALGSFPAMYGLGYGTSLLTFFFSWLISLGIGGDNDITEFFRPVTIEVPTNLISALVMVFLLVVIAPVFEEIWMRGIVYDALKPYGNGIAIVISSILFGLMHGSLNMLFYTTALGLALGYVRYATGSLFAVTILHALINAVAAGMLLFSTLTFITDEENLLINTISNIYLVAMLALIVVGIAAFLMRIPRIRKYKIENAWQGVSGRRKFVLFLASVPTLIMLILAVNEHAGNPLLREFMKLL